MRLPGSVTIPEQIAKDKPPYYRALEAADAANLEGKLDLKALEDLMSAYLANQLVGVYKAATGAAEIAQVPIKLY